MGYTPNLKDDFFAVNITTALPWSNIFDRTSLLPVILFFLEGLFLGLSLFSDPHLASSAKILSELLFVTGLFFYLYPVFSSMPFILFFVPLSSRSGMPSTAWTYILINWSSILLSLPPAFLFFSGDFSISWGDFYQWTSVLFFIYTNDVPLSLPSLLSLSYTSTLLSLSVPDCLTGAGTLYLPGAFLFYPSFGREIKNCHTPVNPAADPIILHDGFSSLSHRIPTVFYCCFLLLLCFHFDLWFYHRSVIFEFCDYFFISFIKAFHKIIMYHMLYVLYRRWSVISVSDKI